MEQKQAYKLDLTKAAGNGDFACPKCGNIISPDETTEETYRILEPKVNSHGLEEIVICFNTYKSHIHLTGFSLLEELSIGMSNSTYPNLFLNFITNVACKL